MSYKLNFDELGTVEKKWNQNFIIFIKYPEPDQMY